MKLILERGRHRCGLLMPQVVVTRVAHDRQEPGTRVASPKRCEVPDGTQARVLNDVSSIFVVSQEIACQHVRRIEVRENRCLERRARVALHVLPRIRLGDRVTATEWVSLPT
jgi:hypothetical protein